MSDATAPNAVRNNRAWHRQPQLFNIGFAILFIAVVGVFMPRVVNAQGGPTVITIPLSGLIDSPCIFGEAVQVEGRMVIAFYSRKTGFTFRTITKLHGTTLDLTAPKKYVLNDENVTENNSAAAFESTAEHNHVMVRQAEADGDIPLGGFGDDFKLKSKLHVTINADGVPNASVTDLTFSCM
jgi:hypothetical protein